MSLLQTYQAIAEQEWIDIPAGLVTRTHHLWWIGGRLDDAKSLSIVLPIRKSAC